jgi:hypothetical protein
VRYRPVSTSLSYSFYTQEFYSGRELNFNTGYITSSDSLTNTNSDPFVSMTFGYWHQIAYSFDKHNVAVYFDGNLQITTQVTGITLTYADYTSYLFADWWVGPMNISTFQYFSNERLSASRLAELQVRLTGLL